MDNKKRKGKYLMINNKRLVILECANNHFGKVEIAKEIIKIAKEQCEPYKDYFDFAIKLQYRDLDTFIHPDYKGNHDIKFVKRFEETKLSWEQFKEIKDYIKECGFLSACTPFDENSVKKVIEHDFDIIKIASCSFTDWNLLEQVVKYDKPIIASCGAVELEDIDKVVMFMKNRNKDFSLLHCIPEYPTNEQNIQSGQVDFFKDRYKGIKVGLSDHSHNTRFFYNSSADIYERHVSLNYSNDYSVLINRFNQILEYIKDNCIWLGETTKRHEIPLSQKETIRSLQRGVYAKEDIKEGEVLELNKNIFLAMPVMHKDQLTANDLSKYIEYIYMPAKPELPVLGSASYCVIPKNKLIMKRDLGIIETRDKVLEIIKQIVPILKKSKVAIPDGCDMEISHHYGIDNTSQCGAIIFNILNNDEYCKKIIVMLPNQQHPSHYHEKKHETFHVLFGSLIVELDNTETRTINNTDDNLIVVDRNKFHSFKTETGCVFEEISTKHYKDDSFYLDIKIANNNRKTKLKFKKEWLTDEIK
jgi:sialic acid synthase SpsE/mannose-6-phosphate isomerase-like protein (cupin superfamily)